MARTRKAKLKIDARPVGSASADRLFSSDADCQRLGNRIGKYREQLFKFLDPSGVLPDNNHGERMIRAAVIIRKNSLCNRSEQGAATQAILMSIYRTLKLPSHDPTKTIARALRTWL